MQPPGLAMRYRSPSGFLRETGSEEVGPAASGCAREASRAFGIQPGAISR